MEIRRATSLSSPFLPLCWKYQQYDIAPIKGCRDVYRELMAESRKLWCLAGPVIFTLICQYSLGAITQIFAGHLGTFQLAAFSVEFSFISGLSYGVFLGMGSALETLCGQAFGAGQIDMLGVYMQRSWIILNCTSIILMIFYIFSAQFFILIGQTEDISRAAGKFVVWMIPQLFAYAMNFPITKFLQSQSKIMAMAWISVVALVLHIIFSWLFMFKLGWGLAGGAVVLNVSWWFIVLAQLIYIFSGTCGEAWSGFSWMAFNNLWGFVKLSLLSAVMLCLDMWYYTALILFAGYLENAKIAVDALSICVRVSNELGAAHPRAARLSVVVVVLTSIVIGLFFSLVVIIFRKQYPSIFTNSEETKKVVNGLTPLLAACLFTNNIQPALSGVAIGAGWQAVSAYVNITCYYVCGIPLGLLLGFKLNMGVKGIWLGMLCGTVIQTLVLCWMACKTNWNKQASIAGKKIILWGEKLEHAAEMQNQITQQV